MASVLNNLRGFSIPFRIDAASRGVAQQNNPEQKLRENLIHILLTGRGERVMRPDYGAGIQDLVHDPNDEALRAIAQHQIARAIAKWEPRILLQRISVYQRDGELVADLRYVVRNTGAAEQIAVPIALRGA